MDAPMRASDQDRQEAVLALSDAFAEGRLDTDEFERRQSLAHEAVYLHDLDPLFADLPSRVAPTSRPVTPPSSGRPARTGRAPHAAAVAAFGLMSAVGTVALVALAAGAVTSGHLLWLLLPLLAFVVARRARRRAYAYAWARSGASYGAPAFGPPPWAGHHGGRPHWHDHR